MKRRATYEDLLSLPDGQIGQIVDGVLHLQPRPAGDHALAASTLGIDIGGPYMRGRGGPGGWWILDGPELHQGEEVLVPDLAGWRRERLAVYPAGPYVTLAPDWVAEVLSPSTAAFDRAAKLPAYAREGVSHLWLLDPRSRTLEIFLLRGGEWVLAGVHAGAAVVRAQPFPEIELALDALWIDVPPPRAQP